ncbi:MAG: type VI secretion system protein TssA [Opitutaceae bacterium]
MIPIDSLLAPVRENAPCGDDPSAAGVLFELETTVQGKPETQFSAAEEPNWKELETRVIEVARTTKDLRVAAILTATTLRTRGLRGLAEGFKLIRGYLEQYWPTVYPLLDATDNNDPTERVNAVASLAAPLNKEGDVYRIIAGLRRVPILSAPRTGVFTLEHYLHIKGQLPWAPEAGQAPTQALLDAALTEIGPTAKEISVVAADLIADLVAIEAYFKSQAGPTAFPLLEPLRRELKLVITWIGLPESDKANEEAAGAPAADGPTRPPAPEQGLSGTVRSRDDVLKALQAIIAYYSAHEPSSPVPFLLTRIKRIVPMNFMQLITELTPEAMDRIMSLTGPLQNDNEPKT